jgi:hypothetical protein
MPPLSAFTASLPNDVLLGTGILVKRGFDNAGLTPIGVTNGGLNWDPKREVRNIPFDGKLYDIEQLDWETGGTPTFEGTFIQLGASQIPNFESGVVTTTPGGNVTTLHTPKEAGLLYGPTDYIDNLCLIFARVSGGYVQVRMIKALCLQYSWAGKNKEEALIQATFIARQTLAQAVSNLGKRSYVIEELAALS